MKKIIILTEGSQSIGFGHIYRCFSLYESSERSGHQVEMYIHGQFDSDEIMNKKIKNANWMDNEFIKTVVQNKCYIIIDSYNVNIETLELIAKKAKEVLYIDDYNRLEYPKGIVINPSADIGNIKYPKNIDTKYLWGRNYIILRDAFKKQNNRKTKQFVKEVLIVIGATDTRGLSIKLLESIKFEYPELKIKINIIIGKNSEDYKKIKAYENKNIKILNDLTSKDMYRVMCESDYAITAIGQTIHELIATETPFIPILVAENQNNNRNFILKNRLSSKVIEWNHGEFVKQVLKAMKELESKEIREEISKLEESLFYANGSESIINRLTINSNYHIRNVMKLDEKAVYDLSNSQEVREVSLNKKSISWDEHVAWFKKNIEAKTTIFHVVSNDDNDFLGQIRYKENEDNAVVSISLIPEVRGLGLSEIMLLESIRKTREKFKKITAYVKCGNNKSEKLFRSCGFVLRNIENNVKIFDLDNERTVAKY